MAACAAAPLSAPLARRGRQALARPATCRPAAAPWPTRAAVLGASTGCRHQRRQRRRQRRLAALQVEAPAEGMPAEAAWQLLLEFTAQEARGLAQPFLNSPANRRRLRDALLVAAAAPHTPAGWNPDAAEVPEVLLGVVSSDVRLAVRALRDYCQALGLPFRMPESRVPGVAAAPAIAGAVYVKYNSASGLCYASQYDGRDRGVLVQLGQRQVGHLPLGMFDEGMARPAPAAAAAAARPEAAAEAGR